MVRALLILCCSVVLSSCTSYINKITDVQSIEEEDQADLSCSYFYFLWGSHAEYNEHFPEALEAYEKALICDENAGYVREKLPVLMLKMGEFDKAATWLEQAIDDHPKDDTYRLFLANLYIQQENVEDAIRLYGEVLEKDPDNEGVHLRLGLLYSHLEQYDTAEAIFNEMLKKNENSYFTHLSLARLLKQIKKHQDAAQAYEKGLALNWSKELAYELGHFYVTQEMYNDALRVYTTITENDEFDERAALSRIQVLLDLERSEESLDELNILRTHSKNPANIDLIISKVLLQNNDADEARAILIRLTQESEDPEPLYMLALLAFQEEDYETSLKYLSRIDKDAEQFEEAIYLQTRVYQKQGDIDLAINSLKKHISSESSRSPLFYALLSSLYQEKGQNPAATTLMKEAISLYPENHQLFFEYGLLLEKNGLTEEAIVQMKQVLELQPDHAEALNFVGYTWADKNMNLEQALEYISKAVELKPNNGFILDSLGWVYYRLGKFNRAATELERSLELEPGDPHIYEHLGDVYIALEKQSDALKAYRKAFQMFVDEKKKSAIKSKIDGLAN